MSEDIREDDDFESGTSVDVEDDQDQDQEEGLELDSDEDESRTKVRKKSSGDDELENYSESVQNVQQENAQMKQKLQQMSVGYNSEAEGRLNAQEAQATRAYAEASEAGDYDRAAKAQQALAQIAVAKDKVQSRKANDNRQKAQEQQQQSAQVQKQSPPQQAPVQRDPKLESWLDKNSWFGNDRVMTRAAQAIHEQLVLEEDFDPTSSDYYKEIDSRMRNVMPQKFKEKRSNAQTVAPTSNGRSMKSGRKKSVELSPGQVSFAKRMRIPLEKYAQEVAKLNKRSE